MKIRLDLFYKHLQRFNFKELCVKFEYIESDGREVIWGGLQEISGLPLPSYFPDVDRWYSFEEDEDEEEYGTQEIVLNIYSKGLANFSAWGDLDVICENIFYNPTEIYDFLKVHRCAHEKILKKKVSYREFKFNDVVEDLYVSVSTEDSFYFRSIKEIKAELDTENFNQLISCFFEGDPNFLINEGNWYSFCLKHQLITDVDSMISIHELPIIINNGVHTNCSPGINPVRPYLGISVKESFSSQYLFDFLRQSKDGEIFINNLRDHLLSNKSLNSLSISAPNSFIHQIKYSTEFRRQYDSYIYEATSRGNHSNESINDLKALYKNRRENIKKFVLDENSATILDILKNPLPFNLEKGYRAYVRSANELDRLTYAGKLYNLVLRSAVFYPLEEILHLGLEESHPEFQTILEEIREGRPLSDGTWLDFFNTIAAVIGRNRLELSHFSPLVSAVQTEYNSFQEIIPIRNDWAHYREHSVEFLKKLDAFLPRVLNILRSALKGNDFLLVEKQNYRHDGLYITAKKIMGFEVDIETVEFKTSLEGRHFVQDSLIVYNEKAGYTVPLKNFFSVRIVQAEAVQMGIYKGGAGGAIDFEY
jgi:hypothetical protein